MAFSALLGCVPDYGEDAAVAKDAIVGDAGPDEDTGGVEHPDAAAPDAHHPDAAPMVDSDQDGIPDEDDPAPLVANGLLASDSFDFDNDDWLFSSVSMEIVTVESVLRVPIIEPFEREGWIGPRPNWGEYLVRSVIRPTGVGQSTTTGNGRLGVMTRIAQVTPSRYYGCGIDIHNNEVILTEHEGVRETVLSAAPLTIELDKWVGVSFLNAGNSLVCKIDGVETSAASSLFFFGSVGFRSMDASFEADWIEVFDL